VPDAPHINFNKLHIMGITHNMKLIKINFNKLHLILISFIFMGVTQNYLSIHASFHISTLYLTPEDFTCQGKSAATQWVSETTCQCILLTFTWPAMHPDAHTL
jgi:hypothetical protein